jgi:hypothetical protein
MQLTGTLTEFSWSDILRFLDQSQQTGYLQLQLPRTSPLPPRLKPQALHFWFSQGYLISAAPKLNARGLLGLIHQQGWLSYQTSDRLARTLPPNMPLGAYLKQQGALTHRQLRSLFQCQVLHPTQTAAALKVGEFTFETISTLPYVEMTGLKLSIYELQAFIVAKAA